MENPKRPGLKSGVRTEFTIIGNVKPGHEQVLRETIKRRAADPRRAEAAKQFGTIHEARVVLMTLPLPTTPSRNHLRSSGRMSRATRASRTRASGTG